MFDKKIGWRFDNTYTKLPESLLFKIKPTPVKKPTLCIFNYDLAKQLNLNFLGVKNNDIASIFSGNLLPVGSESIAQAYAGHQFGHFTILGDGRALIIGEHLTEDEQRFDIQFKGSGKTPYSRSADGRAALGPMLREYLISEAMNNLNIKSSRSLAVVETGENVFREIELRGAVLTRISSSHIRIGTFQYASILKDKINLKKLLDYTINRHYPQIKLKKSPALELLKIVQKKQIELVCDWLRVGFVHGVMNTDNMTISGETIDYGPCAFIDTFNPKTVFSSIDVNGRYCFYNQPNIVRWNLERFAESLITLIDDDEKKSFKLIKGVLEQFEDEYRACWLKMMKNKLGLFGSDQKDEKLILEILSWMELSKADYTNTFCHLTNGLKIKNNYDNDDKFLIWKKKWISRLKNNHTSLEKSLQLMKKSNPMVIPRNHLVEGALKEVELNNDYDKFSKLINILKNPYIISKGTQNFQSAPKLSEKKYVTFCGT